MSFESFTAIAGNTSLIVIAFVVAGWCWIYLRTGSSHALHMRLWRVLTGTREIAHADIRAYIEEQDSLMAFRISSGMRVKSARHARRAIIFVAERGLSSDLIRQVGDYFDANELRMAPKPSNWLRAWHFLTTWIFIVLFGLAGLASLEQRVLVSLKETGTWLWLSEGEAQTVRPTLRGDRPILSFAECPKPNVHGWSAPDVAIVCSIKSDPALGPYLEKARTKQPVVFLAFALLSLAVAVSQWMDFLRANAAGRLAKQLDSGATPTTDSAIAPPVHAGAPPS